MWLPVQAKHTEHPIEKADSWDNEAISSTHEFKCNPVFFQKEGSLKEIAREYKHRINFRARLIGFRENADVVVLNAQKTEWGGLDVIAMAIKYVR